MSLKDVSELIHFRELHLLPRTIFSVGAICLVGAFFLKLFLLGLLGVGLVFVGITLNFAINALVFMGNSKPKEFYFPWAMVLQFFLSGIIAYFLLTLVYHYYREGQFPPYLQPLPRPH